MGYSLVLADREEPGFSPEELAGAGNVTCERLDVSDRDAVFELVAQTMKRHGRIDCLVTVAGVTSVGGFETITEAEYRRVLSINLDGVFFSNQAVMAPMKAQGFGRIVNIGSILAKNGGNARPWLDPHEQAGSANAVYGASKAAVHSLTLYAAKELASHGATANVVAPGPIQSPMTVNFPEALRATIPVGRLGLADEVAGTVAFLLGADAGFITGEIIDVNGGAWPD
ncbi:N-acylmannosamine 1-dehydrogenase [Hyphomonas adhaerens MHS-3]|uniref:N-acylmannosamine 1-dehydrogenase n=2 Tax=Hyphomonas adhaerens TaxID=81029 RepID=A0A069E7S5_9PROT|nr:N-acylmannosamine 1-dehydrogenase [Hyphomonas adhaerens MHS-3]